LVSRRSGNDFAEKVNFDPEEADQPVRQVVGAQGLHIVTICPVGCCKDES